MPATIFIIGGLARAVFFHQKMHFPRIHIQVAVAERFHTAIVLLYATKR